MNKTTVKTMLWGAAGALLVIAAGSRGVPVAKQVTDLAFAR